MNRREILFRGKTRYGHWVYGSLIVDAFGNHQIVTHKLGPKGKSQITDHYEVDPTTIGQFTGLTDSKGNKVFEGDFLHGVGYLCKVVFERGCFRTIYEHPEDGEVLILGEDIDPTDYTVIGTIHDTHLTQQS